MKQLRIIAAGVALGASVVFIGACVGNDDSRPAQTTSDRFLAPAEQTNDTPTPEPRSAEGMYMDQLYSIDGIDIVDSTKAIPAGYKICGYIDTGFSQVSIVAGIQADNPEFTFDQSLAIIAAAERWLCK